jgi:hypothetical protein
LSDFFRIRAPAEFIAKTTRELAELSHQAEETDDDVLLLQVADEIERRKVTTPMTAVLFREHYMDLMAERAKARGKT